MTVLINNVEVEQMVLAAVMTDNGVIEEVSDFLRPEHFFLPANQKLYQAILKLINNAAIADPLTLYPLMVTYIENAREYLAQLAGMICNRSSVKSYARQVYDTYMRRQLVSISQNTAQQAGSFDKSAIAHIQEAEQRLFELAENVDQRQIMSFAASLDGAMHGAKLALGRDSHIVGTTTGLIDLDKCIGGLHKSDLIILAGRPSMGKTSLGLNIAFNAARAHMLGKPEGAKVLFFSLEMSSEQLATRILGQEANIPSDRIRRGALSSADMQFLERTRDQIAGIPLFVDDSAALTLATLRSKARRMKRQENIGLIIIDYLQLLSGNAENRVQELSALTRGLKSIAKELNVPVIAASQLSRAVEQREDKHPQLSDLRESGTIEQDADIVIFIYRESYYLARKKPANDSKMTAWQQEMSKVHGKANLIVAKQRHGPIKNITVHYNEALTKFDNYLI